MSELTADQLKMLVRLREPFGKDKISKLPKGTKQQNECPPAEKKNCTICGGWHHPRVIHLDYVGHAALTDRLLEVDPSWNWEPLKFDDDGLPKLDKNSGLWIKLTVCGVTRLGYGDATGKTGANAVKEIIGDALRNAAMRFGAALDLWSKADLHGDDYSEPSVIKNQENLMPKQTTNKSNSGVEVNIKQEEKTNDNSPKATEGCINLIKHKLEELTILPKEMLTELGIRKEIEDISFEDGNRCLEWIRNFSATR